MANRVFLKAVSLIPWLGCYWSKQGRGIALARRFPYDIGPRVAVAFTRAAIVDIINSGSNVAYCNSVEISLNAICTVLVAAKIRPRLFPRMNFSQFASKPGGLFLPELR